MNQAPQQPQQIQVQLDEKVGQGVYANLVLISHSNAEFVLDFTRMLPGMPKAIVQARVILTPQHAKGLLNALEENVKRYEENFGEIHTPGSPKGDKSFGFHQNEG